jgi:hypothetical protein
MRRYRTDAAIGDNTILDAGPERTYTLPYRLPPQTPAPAKQPGDPGKPCTLRPNEAEKLLDEAHEDDERAPEM